MRKSTLILLALTALFFACGPERQSSPEKSAKGREEANATGNKGRPNRSTLPHDRYTDTRYKYVDASGQPLVIENSPPKGGGTYTTPAGKSSVYSIFWTRITNKTAAPIRLSVAGPADSFKLADKLVTSVALPSTAPIPTGKRPLAPDNYFKIVFPSEEMTEEKARLFNYGLKNVQAVLAHKLQHSPSLQLTVQPKATRFIYVVILASRARDGIMRAGFSVRGDELYYRVNEQEIYCGQATTKHLTRHP